MFFRQEEQKGLLDFFATLNQGKSGAGLEYFI